MEESHPESHLESPWRYNIATLLSGTTAVACMLAYLKRFEPAEFGKGLLIVWLTSLLGALLGLATRRSVETVFWSVMGAMSAFLCAVGGTADARILPICLARGGRPHRRQRDCARPHFASAADADWVRDRIRGPGTLFAVAQHAGQSTGLD